MSWDADEVHETKLELEALSVCLERWSTDFTLRRDLQTAIEFLAVSWGAPADASDEWQDSGYASKGKREAKMSCYSTGKAHGWSMCLRNRSHMQHTMTMTRSQGHKS